MAKKVITDMQCERCKGTNARSTPCAKHNPEKAHLQHRLCPDCITALGGDPTKRYGIVKGYKIERRFQGIMPSPVVCPDAA